MSASPARTRSPSWTMMCLPRGIRYSRVSPLSARTMIFRMPLTNPPISTRPSISVMTACSFGLRASKSSATRGKPPVMSFVRVAPRTIFAITSPTNTSPPSATARFAPTEIDGRVEMGSFVKGMRKIVIRADNGETREYLIPRGKHIIVHESDRVKAGEALMDGSPNPHDYLAVLGDRELQRYLVNEVQEVYRLQGV